MLDRRDSTSHDMLQIASQKIRTRLSDMEPLIEASSVGAHHAIGSEIMTQDIMNDIMNRGQSLLLPALRDGRIVFCMVNSAADLMRGTYGIMEPRRRCPPAIPDILLVPAICVTLQGDRMGYGGGYYDEYLGRHPTTSIAITLEKQIVRKMPRHEHDILVDWVVSESRTHKV